MERKLKIWIKLIAVIVLTIIFVWLIATDERILQLRQPEGTLISREDVWILLNASDEWNMDSDLLEEICKGDGSDGEQEEYLTYADYQTILDCLLEEKEANPQILKLKEELTYKGRYRKDFYLLKSDWYQAYEKLLSFYELSQTIHKERVEILCGNSNVAGEKKLEEGDILTKDGRVYEGVSREFAELKFIVVNAYVRENKLLTLVEADVGEGWLENLWVMECDENRVWFFYKGYELWGELAEAGVISPEAREQVGNLGFKEGKILKGVIKTERIGGKLLGISPSQVEIEGYGKLELAENCVGYQLYEELREVEMSELSVGYHFADFVLEDGRVCAFLITKKETMENIRVLIRNNDFSGLYHKQIVLTCQDGMTIYYGSYKDRLNKKVSAGETFVIDFEDESLGEGRIEAVPDTNTGKIEVQSLMRSQGIPSYRGSMEILKAKEGLVLINEVPLEEYLYSVVPSEMPASYPMEALKAQAVCARTYGYRYLQAPGYGAFGAHVDDSVGYQVYNNIVENMNSTKAVKETTGMMLMYQEEIVNTYYYSTSCGFGADAGVWDESRTDQTPYLNAAYLGKTADGKTKDGELPEDLVKEEIFRSYIMQKDEDAYEKEEPWFRWSYQVENLDTDLMAERVMDRYQAVPAKVLTFVGTDNPSDEKAEYEVKEPKSFQKIYDISCIRRKEGGIMDELLLETDKGTYKIISEYNIRYILNQGGMVIRQDCSSYESSQLLPSAYFAIDIVKEGKSVIGYTIIGGGYGHGVGMSQNGAKAMSIQGRNFQEILDFYYRSCQINKVY